MKKFLIFLLVVLGIGAVAVFTCPDKDAHKEAIQQVIKEAINDEIGGGSDGGLSGVLASLGSSVSGWVLDSRLSVENYFVCSIGKFKGGKEPRVVSVGVFGHIFTFSKEDLKNALSGQGTK